MLQARPHAIHFKRILDFGEGQPLNRSNSVLIVAPHPRSATTNSQKARLLVSLDLERSQLMGIEC